MLVSVHIPKTAGSSLQQLFRHHFGRGLQVDYPAVKATRTVKLMRCFPWLPLAKCIHGHFPASKYRGQLITFVRNPIELRMSKYHYIRREQAKGVLIDEPEWHLASKVTLDEFMALPESDYSKYIDVPLNKFVFIGHMDHYEDDVNHFCDQFLGTRHSIPTTNTNPNGKTYDIEKYSSAFMAASAKQMEIYALLCDRRRLLISNRTG